jgi:type I restriction enzyme R subunit
LFGATYMVLAPEHPLVSQITTPEQKSAVEAYVTACASKSDMDRGDLNKDKSGVFTGACAINPVNQEKIPVWIADYVMMGYGTGAIMAVPAHDERDFEFAKKFNLPVRAVVRSTGVPPVRPIPSLQVLNPEALTKKESRFLPHWQQGTCACFVTWRLADSLPAEKLAALRTERDAWEAAHPEPWSKDEETEHHNLFNERINTWLDAGSGSCILRDPALAGIVSSALEHFDGERYHLYAAVVMPNHVHVLFQPIGGNQISDILQSWKSFTAKAINAKTGDDGRLWQPESFDQLIRNDGHFGAVMQYIRENPEKAGLGEGEFDLIDNLAKERTGGTPVLLFIEHGFAVNSGFLDGLPTAEAKAKMIDWLEANGLGKRRIQFKLRDWLFSRQRYWGEPFPIIWENGNHAGIPDRELPLLQPELEDFKPTGDPRGPLIKATDWIAYSATDAQYRWTIAPSCTRGTGNTCNYANCAPYK